MKPDQFINSCDLVLRELSTNKHFGQQPVKIREEMEKADQEAVQLIQTLEEQVGQVTKAIKNEPSKERQILMVFLSRFFDAIKETVRRLGDVMPLTITLADPV